MKTPKVLIVGLDSATFDLARPWIAEGKLPSLTALMQNGAWGRLASVVPPITPPAWTSFMTGKNPGKHGIFHFLEASPGRYGLRYLNAGSRRAKTIWRILSDTGYTVGTMNIRSEEHTSELQSRGHLVCRLLLEKKKCTQNCC